MIAYLIKSGLCLAILLAFYHLVLEREKMHQFNRFYLLGSVLFAFLVPFTTIYVEATQVIADTVAEMTLPASQDLMLEKDLPMTQSSIAWSDWLLFAYLFISSLFLIRFLKNLVDLVIKIKTNEIIEYANAKLVLVSDDILPHTFWNYIFINKDEYLSKKVEKELFTHELTHVTQKHTLDVLIVEALQVVLWFNPFFYPLKKAIQLNHEFLADDKVIASHKDIPKYQYLLLDKAAWKNKYYLASNLNYSLTKKRLLMMKVQNSKSTILWKKLAIIPLVGGLIFLFAERVEAQTNEKKVQIKEVKIKGATKAQMKTYVTLYNSARKDNIYKRKDVANMQYIYGLMTEKQRKSVKNIDDILPPLPPRPTKIEVVKKKKLPPPPPKQKKKVKKLKEVKVEKDAKSLKEKKTGWDLLEEQMHDPSLIKPNKDLKKEEEINFNWDNYEERAANIAKYRKKKKVEEVEVPYEEYEQEKKSEAQKEKENFERMVKKGARFYLNGKKVTAKKIKPYFFEKKKKVKTLRVKDNNGDIKVRIRTRG